MTKLNKKYVIGTHIMWFEIEMYKDFIDGMVNLLETVDNKENVTIDLCLNLSQHLETIDSDPDDIQEAIDSTKELYDWFTKHNINFRILSDTNPADKRFKRMKSLENV